MNAVTPTIADQSSLHKIFQAYRAASTQALTPSHLAEGHQLLGLAREFLGVERDVSRLYPMGGYVCLRLWGEHLTVYQYTVDGPYRLCLLRTCPDCGHFTRSVPIESEGAFESARKRFSALGHDCGAWR